jgi:hypothetical protein
MLAHGKAPFTPTNRTRRRPSFELGRLASPTVHHGVF